MKKLLLIAVAAIAVSPVMAQSLPASQWGSTDTNMSTTESDVDYYNGDVFNNKYFKVSYVNEKFQPKGNLDGYEVKSDWGVALDWGGMSCFTHKPIARMVNIGLDVHFAASYASYKEGIVENLDEAVSRSDDDSNDPMHHASIGIGVGPAVAVAPFAHFDNILRYLTAKAYYHFTPSCSALIYKDVEDETAFKAAFCLYRSFGMEIGYRRLGIGFETMTGTAKYSDIDFDPESYYPGSKQEKGEKLKVSTPSFRISVSYKF